jgi:hypothetical protein
MEGFYLLRQGVLDGVASYLKVVTSLKVAPELGGCPEISAKTQGGVRGDAAFFQDNFVDAPGRHMNFLGEPILAYAQGGKKFLSEDFSGMNGGKISFAHGDTP